MIIDSSYNSSPAALLAAINLVKEVKIRGKKIGVLGDMKELGELAREEHEKVGKEAAKNFDFLVFVGPLMKKYAFPAALKAGFSEQKIFWFDKSKGVGEFVVKKLLDHDDLILIKGSQNTIFLEQVVYEIIKEKDKAKELLCRQSEYWEKTRKRFFENY